MFDTSNCTWSITVNRCDRSLSNSKTRGSFVYLGLHRWGKFSSQRPRSWSMGVNESVRRHLVVKLRKRSPCMRTDPHLPCVNPACARACRPEPCNIFNDVFKWQFSIQIKWINFSKVVKRFFLLSHNEIKHEAWLLNSPKIYGENCKNIDCQWQSKNIDFLDGFDLFDGFVIFKTFLL